jgi:predicted Zn-dependent peptidase
VKQTVYEPLQETRYTEVLDNGLTVCVVPKSGYRQVFATFSTKYGSIDSHFVTPEGREVRVPDGIAHFLEHKMFEEEHGDVFHDFARQGASANAYTTYDMTTYLFSCTDHLMANLETLVDFVQRPYFTDENVEKEKGIIGQEIQMYHDNPDWRVFENLLKGLYHAHPVRINIAGTLESIAAIDKETLLECWNTFYHPGNMILFVVGGADPAAVIELVRNNQQKKRIAARGEIRRIFPEEPAEVKEPWIETRMAVSLPRCLIGFKEAEAKGTGAALLQREVATALVFDVLFGKSSTLYSELFESGLVDAQFGYEYETGEGYAFSVVGGTTKDPERMTDRIRTAIGQALDEGLPADRFERSRRRAIGQFIKGLDSPRFIARHFSAYRFKGIDFFATLPALQAITLEEANRRMREHFDFQRMSVSVVRPGQESQGTGTR